MQHKKFLKVLAQFIVVFLLSSYHLKAQNVHSDNGNGTYTNPLISSDLPDPDVIRVGGTYYMVNTTMFILMRFSLKIFTGNKFCLFNYATKMLGGFVDFDSLTTQ